MFSQVAWQTLFSKFLCKFSNVTFCILFLLCNLNWNVHLSLLEQISLSLSLSLFFHDWGGCLLLCKYLSMGSGAFGAPPSLFSLLQWSPRVWSCAYEFCLRRHCCICLHFMCTTQRDVYPLACTCVLSSSSSFPYREWANSRPCRIPNTSVGPLGCQATLHYLPTFIFSSGSVPAVLYYS